LRIWVENAYQNEWVNRMKLMNLRPVKAVALATWLYSLLFLIYLTFRLTFNASHVQLDDLFIDHVPFFTFLVTGIFLMVINLTSIGSYLAIRRIYRRQTGSISGGEADRSLGSISGKSFLTSFKDKLKGNLESIGLRNLHVKTLIIWTFSISIWTYLSYQSLAHPPSPPYWPISMMMFVISYLCLVYMLTARDSRMAIRSA
jgi:hypothetical protein